MNKSKGFTIIELIVVIAIIAVLAAIVLVNVTQYISKGKNASIKANLATVLTNGAVYYDSSSYGNGDYYVDTTHDFCKDLGNTLISVPKAAIVSAMGVAAASTNWQCNVRGTTNDAWCACAMELPVGTTGTVYCVDSTGAKAETTSTDCSARCTAGATATDAVCK